MKQAQQEQIELVEELLVTSDMERTLRAYFYLLSNKQLKEAVFMASDLTEFPVEHHRIAFQNIGCAIIDELRMKYEDSLNDRNDIEGDFWAEEEVAFPFIANPFNADGTIKLQPAQPEVAIDPLEFEKEVACYANGLMSDMDIREYAKIAVEFQGFDVFAKVIMIVAQHTYEKDADRMEFIVHATKVWEVEEASFYASLKYDGAPF